MLNFLLAVLASYRLAYLMAYEDGPFGLADKWRGWVLAAGRPDHWLTRGMNCALCLSFWWAAAFAFWVRQPGEGYLLAWFGVAGGAMLVHFGVKLVKMTAHYVELEITGKLGG